MPSTRSFPRALVLSIFFAGLGAVRDAASQVPLAGDVGQGRVFFQQNCAMCHADSLGPGNSAITRQGPSLVGVLGRRAGSLPNFNFTNALSGSGVTWDSTTLERFLADPMAIAP